MPPSGLREQRRFTAIVVCHPALNDFSVLEKSPAFANSGSPVTLETAIAGWESWRFEYVIARSLYPRHIVDPAERSRADGYAHDVYFAQRSLDVLEARATVLASPYIRLLGRMASSLERALPPPAPQYLAFDMSRLYTEFARYDSEISATKVTMQILNEPKLQLVSLAGSNPLHSKLHAAIREVAAPYALRADMRAGEASCRINIDRHGNIWWYQTDESRLQMVLTFLDLLSHHSTLRLTRHLPLVRASKEGDL